MSKKMVDKDAEMLSSLSIVTPTLLVGANVNGRPNFMAAAWATIACMAPPMVCVAINHSRFTAKGIDQNSTFSLNVPSTKDAVSVDYCGIVSGSKEDKSTMFETFYGKLGSAPMINDMPVNIECKVFRSVNCGSHMLYIGQVTTVHIDEDRMTNNKTDIEKIDPIVYASSEYRHLGSAVAKAFSVGKTYNK
jgi:flavin reductase (DIM6/NTAB) family NADH-FMN oxidoreductase RutF